MRSVSYKWLIFVFIFLGVLSSPFFVFSHEDHEEEGTGGNTEEITTLNKQIEDKKEKVKELEKSIAEYKKKIEQKQLEAKSLSNQLNIMDNRITQVQLDIQATQETLDTINLEIARLELTIANKEASIEKQKKILGELVRILHYHESKKYIEVLAAYDNFSDFYNKVQNLEDIEEDVGRNTKSLRIAKEELQEKKDQTEERKLSYEELNEKLDARKDDLQEQIEIKEDLLVETKTSEATYKTLVANLKKQYQQTEGEISGIEAQVRKKLEKQAKIDDSLEGEGGLLSWPTQSRFVTAYFYDTEYPYRHIFEHNAIDIKAPQGTSVKAAASGYIARAKKCTTASCYAYIMIVHSGGISTVYGHLSQVNVTEDQFVSRGEVIGRSGAAKGTVGAGPFTTGAHLHFEVRKNGIPVNPLNYLVKDY